MTPTAHTRLALLLGDPVAHSRSPAIHNAAFRALGIDAVYLASRVAPEDLGDAVAGLRALGVLGANVTIPHKQAILPHLDALTPVAEAIGAVNTVVPQPDGTLLGTNTDAAGFFEPLRPYADQLDGADQLNGAEAVVFGAGGAARAVVYALLTEVALPRLTLVARSPAKAKALADDFTDLDPHRILAVRSNDDASAVVRSATLLVNATPLGMHGTHEAATPWSNAADFHAEQIAYDLVYTPAETRFLREAAARGATALGGIAMLIGQAAEAFRLWTGQTMPEALGFSILDG
ncbi:MAG: shikimate dehydrogenase [Bacteroidota bacterium]